ncbi:MAG: histidine--tRNA ligase [Planctomycetota bacterium]
MNDKADKNEKAEKKPKQKKAPRTVARVNKGFRDVFADVLTGRMQLLDRIRRVYERYGFQPLETPALEYLDVLGKFLPESEQPDAGVFAFRNDDDEWVALRYDLTAPLSRVVAQYQNDLQRPFRRYQAGPVWRMEKPGPGRFREFWQFDFDTVGASSMMADAECCCIMADALESIGVSTGQYLVQVNNRKVLDGVIESCGVTDDDTTPAGAPLKLNVMRTIDKLDKVGLDGVRLLLQKGRKDESGDFTPGCGLKDEQVDVVIRYFQSRAATRAETCDRMLAAVGESAAGREGVEELREIDRYLTALGYAEDRVIFEPTVVRGLAYYTGPVFEAVLTVETVDEDGKPKQFGAVMGGGRYDDLVTRFTGQAVPAVGASMGVDRMLSALQFIGRLDDLRPRDAGVQVLVTVMDKARRGDYLLLAKQLREAGIGTDVYMGNKPIGQQVKYADRLKIPFAVVAGSDEFDRGVWQVKDLALGEQLSANIDDPKEFARAAQSEVPASELIARLKELIAARG